MVPWVNPRPHPKQHLNGSAVFLQVMILTDRQTDRPCYPVCNSRLHLAGAVMQPKIEAKTKKLELNKN